MPRKRSGRVTVVDVAKEAGVSFSAVSKVLRNAYGVSDGLREKVEAAIQKLGYRPDLVARAMHGQTNTLGVLLPDLHNSFFGDIMAGVNEALRRTNYQALLGVGDAEVANEHALVMAMIDRQMDGLILISPSLSRAELDDISRRTPTTIIGLHAADAVAFDTVNNDDRLGASLVVNHLVAGGHENIVFLSLDHTAESGGVVRLREQGYSEAMNAAGLARHATPLRSPQAIRDIHIATRDLLEKEDRPTAIFCWTDFVALEVISVVKRMGLRVPHDIAVIGYDNTSACELFQNSLTSVDQSGQVLGLQAARLLVERIDGRTTVEHLVTTPRIVTRESSGVPKKRTAPTSPTAN